MSAGRGKKGARSRARTSVTPATRTERRRWTVDAIEANVARVEEDGERVVHVPRWMLPDGARPGSVLSVTREAEGERLVLRIEPDAAAEGEALARSRRQVASETGDEGGDVVL